MRRTITRRNLISGAAAVIAAAPALAQTPLGFLDPSQDVAPSGRPAVWIVHMASDVMSPRYRKGERVFFHPCVEPVPGEDAVIEGDIDGGPVFFVFEMVRSNDDAVVVRQFCPPLEHVFHRSTIRSIGRGTRPEDLM